MKATISPSLLACDFLHLEDEVKRAESAGADMLHCDVMDGVYVPNISFGFDIIKKIHSVTNLPLDVHMMTSCPGKYIDVLKAAGASSVTLHHEIMEEEELIETLKYIKASGMKAAVSLKPKYPAEEAFAFLEYCDMVLVMTVEPGFGGQKFMYDMLPKVSALREYIDKNKLNCSVQVDGGVGEKTIADCAKAGADCFVVGTAAFGSPDMKETVAKLKSIAENTAD